MSIVNAWKLVNRHSISNPSKRWLFISATKVCLFSVISVMFVSNTAISYIPFNDFRSILSPFAVTFHGIRFDGNFTMKTSEFSFRLFRGMKFLNGILFDVMDIPWFLNKKGNYLFSETRFIPLVSRETRYSDKTFDTYCKQRTQSYKLISCGEKTSERTK